MDEAGTSAKEPVSVVVGLIAHADEHVMSAEALADEALGAVPAAHRANFVFHATDVFGSQKYQQGWSLTSRLDLLTYMMSIPRRIGMAVTVGALWRGSVDWSHLQRVGLSPTQWDHVQAFALCIAAADRNIRRHAGPREVATVVAEDVPELRRVLRGIPRAIRQAPFTFPPELLRQTVSDLEAGFCKQVGDMRVTRIRNSVHFVEKADDPLVQVADACAYGLRRFFAGEKFGVDFSRAVVGDVKKLRKFSSPGGVEFYRPRPG
jgi:hypothetical protein